MRDFNVITFNDFKANTGDIEGRLAAKRDVTLGNGYSIGYELHTFNNQPDNSLPYSLVAGRNVNWGSGSLHPDGSGIPYPGDKEDMFVGGSYNGDNQLALRVHGPCGASGCLDSYFNAAQTCYEGYQTTLAAQSDNVQKAFYWSGLFITCDDVNADSYTVSLTPAEMTTYTYTTLDNCNLQASWTINVKGSGDVLLTGDSFPGLAGGVVYNVIGSGRIITVTETSVNGHLLAPNNFLNQTGGVIVGKVVAADILMSLQINKQNNCPNPENVTVTVPSSEPTYVGSNNFPVLTPSFIRSGDQVTVSGQSYDVTSVTKNSISVSPAAKSNYAAGTLIKASINGANGRVAMDEVAPSSASVLSVTFALFALLALFF